MSPCAPCRIFDSLAHTSSYCFRITKQQKSVFSLPLSHLLAETMTRCHYRLSRKSLALVAQRSRSNFPREKKLIFWIRKSIHKSLTPNYSPNPGHTSLSKRFSVNDAMLAGAFESRQPAHYAQMYMSEPSDWDDRLKHLMDLYDELEERDKVVGLQDQAFTDTNQLHPLKIAVDADMADSDFVSLCLRYQNPKLFIPKGGGSKIKGGGFVLRPPLYKEDLYIPSICSERLNSTLFIAGRDNLFPVCGNKLYVHLLKAKLKRAEIAAPAYATPPGSVHRFSLLSWEVVTEVVPRNVIQSKSANDLLIYKDACIDLKENSGPTSGL